LLWRHFVVGTGVLHFRCCFVVVVVVVVVNIVVVDIVVGGGGGGGGVAVAGCCLWLSLSFCCCRCFGIGSSVSVVRSSSTALPQLFRSRYGVIGGRKVQINYGRPSIIMV